MISGHRGGEIAERTAALDDDHLMAFDCPEAVEAVHDRAISAGGSCGGCGGNFFGDFDDQTFLRNIHVFGAAAEKIRMLVAAVMSPRGAAGTDARLKRDRAIVTG